MPNIFISHDREDVEFATQLSASLKSQDLEVWTDENDLEPGIKWAMAIEEAISSSKNVLFVLSDKGKRSGWLQTEAAMALTQGGKRVIPIYCTKHAEVPFILQSFKGMDFSDSSSYSVQIKRLIEVLSTDVSDSDVDIEQDDSAREHMVKLQTSLIEREMAQHEELERLINQMYKLQIRNMALISVMLAISVGVMIMAIPAGIITEVIVGATGTAVGLVLGLALDLVRKVRKRFVGS